MIAAMAGKAQVQALLFDVFGTVVDWRSSIIAELTSFGAAKGITADWAQFADDWRGLYEPAMEEVRSGRRAWTILDILHRESLDTLLAKHSIAGLSEAEKDHINRVWHRLRPWPDVVDGLARLKRRHIIGTLSNGNVGLLTRMAKNAGLPWDVVLGAETARAYKPLPQAYLASAALLNLEPGQVMLVAAHNGDLAAAAAVGLRTAFVARPTEYGPHQKVDFKADRDWDIVTDGFGGVASAMGC
jgi:2-haloacid dehalogenase